MTSNKEIAEAFRITKEIHAAGKTFYICNALRHAYADNNINARIYYTCLIVIRKRLGGFGTVNAWLIDNGVDSRKMTDEAMFQYRQAWLDKLIEEFSNDDWYN